MSKIVDMEPRRAGHELKRKDAKAQDLREALRNAREGEPDKQQSTQKLLKVFKRKPKPLN